MPNFRGTSSSDDGGKPNEDIWPWGTKSSDAKYATIHPDIDACPSIIFQQALKMTRSISFYPSPCDHPGLSYVFLSNNACWPKKISWVVAFVITHSMEMWIHEWVPTLNWSRKGSFVRPFGYSVPLRDVAILKGQGSRSSTLILRRSTRFFPSMMGWALVLSMTFYENTSKGLLITIEDIWLVFTNLITSSFT